MKRYSVRLVGATPLLMHYDNLAWDEVIKKWQKDPANKALSVAGDDRTPAWRWIGYLYTDGGMVAMPADNLMSALREGGKKVSTGRGQQTFKALTQAGIIVDQAAWAFETQGRQVSYDQVSHLIENHDFNEHMETAKKLGFELFVKRAKIGKAKHVRVRPRFDNWQAYGSLTVLEDQLITDDVLRLILINAGAYCGLCDWRPGSPMSPGVFGKFSVEMSVLKQ